jgi:DNA-directed RNA polymerase subunit RPC12/RpoP
MQAQLFCATCAAPFAFKVPELTGNLWHVRCEACGARTALVAIAGAPEEPATFSAAGIYMAPTKPRRKTETA